MLELRSLIRSNNQIRPCLSGRAKLIVFQALVIMSITNSYSKWRSKAKCYIYQAFVILRITNSCAYCHGELDAL